MQYRRVFVPGGTYFFTLVTFNRQPIFSDPVAVEVLRQSFRHVMARLPFTIIADVIIPDHSHFIWKLPEHSSDYSTRWRLIKSNFTMHYHPPETGILSASRESKGEGTIWQRRFWEHLIRDEDDLANHIDYIHYNPVKHGLTAAPSAWPYSSFGKFVREGLYPGDWGADPARIWKGDKRME